MLSIKRFSFAQNLLLSVIFINIVCGLAVITQVSITETKALKEDRAAGLYVAMDNILAGISQSIRTLGLAESDTLSSIIVPSLEANPTVDAVLLMKMDLTPGFLDWSRAGDMRKATDDIPFILLRAIAERGEFYAEHENYRIYGRKIFNADGEQVGYFFAAIDDAVSVAAVVPRLKQLGYQLLMVFAFQLLVMAFLLNRMLSVPLKRIARKFSRLADIDSSVGEELGKLGELQRIERSTEMLAASAKAKTSFLANMSHEIRTPMNGILGMLDLLAETELTDEQRAQLTTVTNSAESLLTILNDILDLSKIEAGKIALETSTFDLGALTEDVSSLFMPAAAKKGVDVICYIDPEIQYRCIGDPVRVRQIFSNIIGNAVKFTSEGEVLIRVTLEKDEFVPWSVVFTVRDTGVGMTEDTVTELFQPFYQADGSATRRFGGTGLGLSISKQLVELMDGRIHVASKEGEGSQFTVKLPLGFSETPVQYDTLSSLAKDTRIMVVDDNDTNLEIVSHYLESWELEHHCEQDPLLAIEEIKKAQARGRPYTLVLLDYLMPDMDGLSLVTSIRGLEGPAPLFIMVSSATVEQEQLEVAGIDARVPKPIRKKLLLGAIIKVITDSRGTPPVSASQGSAKDSLSGDGEDRQVKTLSGRVLLVEDNATNQLVARAMLEKIGLSPEVVENGKLALEKMHAGSFDLVLMDCLMPVMDGYQATRAWRDQEGPISAADRLKIVALTANAQEEDRQKCLDAGMDDYLAKPMNLAGLEAIVRKWL